MNKLELKKIAIESLSASGALLQQGKCHEALEAANQAWEAYFELQKMRDEDEDFTDLIYAARNQYEKCQRAIAECAVEPKFVESEPDKEKEFAQAEAWKAEGEKGDYKAALNAADWFADDENWHFIIEHCGEDYNFRMIAAQLYQSAVNNSEVWMEHRAYASYRLGLMFLLPLYGNVNMESALKCFQWAADRMLELESPTKSLLIKVLDCTIEALCFTGDIQKAAFYAKKATDNGADMGIYFYMAYIGIIKKEKSAQALIDAMVEAGTWEGLLLNGIKAMLECYRSEEGAEERLSDISQKMMAYLDKHEDTFGGDAIGSFLVYRMFFYNGFEFFDSESMDFLREIVKKGNVWGYCYYGMICELAIDVCPDPERAQAIKKEAAKYLGLGANNGNREALKNYYYFLKENGGSPSLIEAYKEFAKQYVVKV